MASGENGFLGLIVDVVEEVINVNVQDIEATPDFGTKLDTDYILGMAKVRDTVKAILDIDRIVACDLLQTAAEKSDNPKPEAKA